MHKNYRTVDWSCDTPRQLAKRTDNSLWTSPLLVWDTDQPLHSALSMRYNNVVNVRNRKLDLYEFVALVGDMDKLPGVSLKEWEDIYDLFYAYIYPTFPKRENTLPIYLTPEDVKEFYAYPYLTRQELCKYLPSDLAHLTLAYEEGRESKIPTFLEKAIPEPSLLELIEAYAREPLLRPKIIRTLRVRCWEERDIPRILLTIAVLVEKFPPLSPQQTREIKEKLGNDALSPQGLGSYLSRYWKDDIRPLLNIFNEEQLTYIYSLVQEDDFTMHMLHLWTTV